MRRYNEEFRIPEGKGDYEWNNAFEDWLCESFSIEFAEAWWEMDADFVENILVAGFLREQEETEDVHSWHREVRKRIRELQNQDV